MSDSLVFMLLFGFAVVISFAIIKLFYLINKTYSQISRHTHSISTVSIPDYVPQADEAVFTYDPRTGYMPLYEAIIDYFREVRSETFHWKHFSYGRKDTKTKKLKYMFPVGWHSFTRGDNKLWLGVYDPVLVPSISIMRNPLRIILKGKNSTENLHDLMKIIATPKEERDTATQSKVGKIIPFKSIEQSK